ncbi:hypothetical protein LJC61_07430 [Ruminococcaceae bacterium OttesenSCG-928-A16]|nr:hypothetical protein [Ruminococcaceae bacterium OttesenSCG-928-A16]
MSKDNFVFDDFLLDVTPETLPFVSGLHEYLLANGCGVKIQSAKSGYVVSYLHTKSKKVVANYVSRKKGLVMRIYGNNAAKYTAFIETLPATMKAEIEKAPVCKRLLDPTKCSSKCTMGNIFTLDGIEHKKCRYNSFMFLLTPESMPFIKSFLLQELTERNAV